MANWADLPADPLSLILSNVYSIKDRFNMRLVCKSWNSVALLSPCRRQTPCLMFYQNSKSSWKLYKYSGFFRECFEDFEEAEILYSSQGWLLVSFDRFELYFLNPSDGEAFEATDPDAPPHYYNRYCFIDLPTSPNCIIVGLGSTGISVNIGVLKLGDNNWSEYTFDGMEFLPSVSAPVLHEGLLYYLDVEGNLGTFNIEERSTFTIHADCLLPDLLQGELRQHFLVKLNGEEEEGEEKATILAVFVYGYGKKVKVYKLLKREMKWELVKSLGDKMLYVSKAGSFAETAPVRSMANKIYFPYLYDGDDSVVYYSLDTKGYHSFGGKYLLNPRKYLSSAGKHSQGNCNGLTDLPFATWVANVSPK